MLELCNNVVKLISPRNGLLRGGKSNQRAVFYFIFFKGTGPTYLFSGHVLGHVTCRVIVKTSLTELLLMKKKKNTTENFLNAHFRWTKAQMTLQSEVQGRFLRMKLFRNNQKPFAKV